VSDAEGRFVIPDAPGGAWQLAGRHERVGTVRLRDKATLASGDAGVADLGELTLGGDGWGEKPGP
jgi:hypothetical protein